jgi:uncharacterized protein (DUF2267 family)
MRWRAAALLHLYIGLMNHDAIVGEIQHRAHLPSRGDAEAAIRATLTTLADRIPQGTARHLADQLPGEIANHLRHGIVERLPLDEFCDRISEREGVDRSTATFHARIVLTLLAEAVSPGVMSKVRRELPHSFDSIFLPEKGAATGELVRTAL